MADTSQWPVVVSGLLGGLIALSGTVVTLIATAHREAARLRHEANRKRADKFEELVAAVYEFDHWLGRIRQRVIGASTVADLEEIVSPFGKVQSISSVYLQQFGKLVTELDNAATRSQIWIYQAKQR